MLRQVVCLFFILNYCLQAFSQIISGPMLGPVEVRDAKIWIEVAPTVKQVHLKYHKKNEPGKFNTVIYRGELGNEFNPIQITIGGLEMNTTYDYTFIIDGKQTKQKGTFTTKDLWQWRKSAPDFSFLTGSCSYFNESKYDRPGKPYGGDSSIFVTMAKEKAAFMLWLGDNWYTREVDFFSDWGLWYRAQYDRKMPVLQNFLKAMPQIAMWDDHDYGPDNSGSNFILKETSRTIFKNYWCNPSYGENDEGVYTKYNYSDVDIFLCDDRWWRSVDRWKDSVNGISNVGKIMLGAKQMSWLKNSLLHSDATFKIIMIGSQVLNQVSRAEDFPDFPIEYNELMKFLNEYKIPGVLFLTGDRHHSEIIKMERPGTYTLFDVTVSPLTSGISKVAGNEINHPQRIIDVIETYNYARFSFSGAQKNRELKVEFFGTQGQKLGEWITNENALK